MIIVYSLEAELNLGDKGTRGGRTSCNGLFGDRYYFIFSANRRLFNANSLFYFFIMVLLAMVTVDPAIVNILHKGQSQHGQI